MAGAGRAGPWEGHDDEAAAAVAEGLRWCAERDPEGILPHVSSPWYPLALRLEADRAERAAARRAAEEVAEARQRAAPVLAALDRLAAAPAPQARLPAGHRPPAARPSRASPGWKDGPTPSGGGRRPLPGSGWSIPSTLPTRASGRPRRCWPAARPASQAETALRSAHQTAVTLGAGPLRREIELLAQRGRLRLEEPVDTAAAPKAPLAGRLARPHPA